MGAAVPADADGVGEGFVAAAVADAVGAADEALASPPQAATSATSDIDTSEVFRVEPCIAVLPRDDRHSALAGTLTGKVHDPIAGM